MGKQEGKYSGHRYSSISEVCKVHGVNYITLRTRLRAGWDLDKALGSGTGINEQDKDYEGSKGSIR